MKILIEYIAGLGDILIDIAYFKKYKEKYPNAQIDISTDKTSAELFKSCNAINVVEIKKFNASPEDIDLSIKNKYDKHLQISGLMSWAFYAKVDKMLYKARGDAFFPEIDITLEDMYGNIPSLMPDDMLLDFDIPVIISAPAPQRVAQGKTISENLWNDIINYFKDIAFIQIGSKDFDYSFNQNNVVDLRDKLNIVNALGLIPYSKFLIGVDNILNHASVCFKKRGLFFWGSNSPNQYGYKQNINLYNPKKCSPCLYNRLFDKTQCCQYPNIDTISFKETKKAIKKLLKELR